MSNLDGLHPTLRFKAESLVRLADKKGIKIIITQGLRTIAYQNSLYAQGRTTKGSIVTNAKGGYSYHNFGLAFDFAIVNPDGKTVNWNTSIDLNKDGQKDWFQVAELGQSLGLEAGAFWKSFLDVPHLQLTFGLTTAQLRSGKKAPYNSDKGVLEFQQLLNKLGANIEEDGIYGEASIAAVKNLQLKHGLTVDGIVGTKTYDRFEFLTKLEAINPSPTKEVKGVSEVKQIVSDTHKEAWEWAKVNKLMNGENPKNPLTREQFATVLKRLYDDLKK